MPESKIVVVSMGPEQAKKALKECLAVGADKAYLLSGREFGGSDTLATSYALSSVKNKIEEIEGLSFDIIFLGKQAIDGDTGQVGPEMAEHLDLPQITFATEVEVDGAKVRVKRETDGGHEIIGATMPCVITATKPQFEPRYPTIKGKMAANRAEIPTIGAQDLPTLDLTVVGLKGSPTRVKKTFTPQVKKGGVKIQEETGEASAWKLFDLICEAKVI